MKRRIVCGDINQSDEVFIQDSSSTTGAGLTGLVYNSASLTAYYARPLEVPVEIPLVTQTVTGAHTDGGFKEIDATNMPGFYRFDSPDAMFVAGKLSVSAMLKGASNMAPLPIEFGIRSLQDMGLLYKGTVSSVAGGQTDLTISTPRSDVVDDYIGAAIIRDVDNVPSAATVEITAYDGAGVITLEAAAPFPVEVGDVVEIAMALSVPTAAEIALAYLTYANGIETGFSPQAAMRIILASASGKSSGAELDNPKFFDPSGTKARIDTLTEANNNRTSVNLDISDV